MNPFAQLAAAGVSLALGSDAPVTALDPWAAVRAAAHHRTPGSGISPRAAFAAATRGAWRAGGARDGVAGTLIPGAPGSYAVWEVDELVVSAPETDLGTTLVDRSALPGATLAAARPGCAQPALPAHRPRRTDHLCELNGCATQPARWSRDCCCSRVSRPGRCGSSPSSGSRCSRWCCAAANRCAAGSATDSSPVSDSSSRCCRGWGSTSARCRGSRSPPRARSMSACSASSPAWCRRCLARRCGSPRCGRCASGPARASRSADSHGAGSHSASPTAGCCPSLRWAGRRC